MSSIEIACTYHIALCRNNRRYFGGRLVRGVLFYTRFRADLAGGKGGEDGSED